MHLWVFLFFFSWHFSFCCLTVSSRNAWREPWPGYSRGDIGLRGIHPHQTHMSHTTASLSHRLDGRVQPPPHIVAGHHGTQGSAQRQTLTLLCSLSNTFFIYNDLHTIIRNPINAMHTQYTNPTVWVEYSTLTPLLPVTSSASQTAPGPVNIPVFQPVRPLPSLQFQVERVNVEHSVPMYAPELISTVSSLSQPSDNLLHHCYAHVYLKVSATVFCWVMIWTNSAIVLLQELFLHPTFVVKKRSSLKDCR